MFLIKNETFGKGVVFLVKKLEYYFCFVKGISNIFCKIF